MNIPSAIRTQSDQSTYGFRGRLWLLLMMTALPGALSPEAAAGPPGVTASGSSVASVSPQVVVDDCRTWFPYRRRLAAERSGILATTPQEGTRFQAGEVVARLNDQVTRAAVAVSEKKASNDADVRHAVKAYELLKFSFDRVQATNSSRPGSFDADEIRHRELETVTASIRADATRHAFEVMQLELEQSREELRTYEIRTDRGGIVTRVIKHDGEGVQPGEEVLEIVDTSVIRVEGYAPGRQIRHLQPGQPVTVTVLVPTGDQPGVEEIALAGKLGFVDVTLTSGGEVRVWVDITLADQPVLEGLTARISIAPQP